MDISMYSDETFFSSLFAAFNTGWEACMTFITQNTWLMIVVGFPVILGLAGAVISFIKLR